MGGETVVEGVQEPPLMLSCYYPPPSPSPPSTSSPTSLPSPPPLPSPSPPPRLPSIAQLDRFNAITHQNGFEIIEWSELAVDWRLIRQFNSLSAWQLLHFCFLKFKFVQLKLASAQAFAPLLFFFLLLLLLLPLLQPVSKWPRTKRSGGRGGREKGRTEGGRKMFG